MPPVELCDEFAPIVFASRRFKRGSTNRWRGGANFFVLDLWICLRAAFMYALIDRSAREHEFILVHVLMVIINARLDQFADSLDAANQWKFSQHLQSVGDDLFPVGSVFSDQVVDDALHLAAGLFVPQGDRSVVTRQQRRQVFLAGQFDRQINRRIFGETGICFSEKLAKDCS